MTARFSDLPLGFSFPLDIRWLVLMALIIGTLGFFKFYDRYTAVGPELLVDPGFQAGFTHWDLTGLGSAVITGPGEITLHAGEKERGAGVAVRQWLGEPQRYRLLRLSGELKADDIRPGERFWHKGRLVLASFDTAEHMLRVPHIVADLVGTHTWQIYQADFHVPTTAHQVQVGLQLIGATGSLSARHLSLRAVEEQGYYPIYQKLGMILWGIALLWLALSYRDQWRLNPPYLLIYGAIAGIFMGTLIPVETKLILETDIEALILHWAPRLGFLADADRHGDPALISKLGHLLLFGLLAFALRWAHPRQGHAKLLCGLLLLALISEVLQFFVEGRVPQFSDWLIDSLGLVIGLILFEIARKTYTGVRCWLASNP